MNFWASLLPCENAMKAADAICAREKTARTSAGVTRRNPQ